MGKSRYFRACSIADDTGEQHNKRCSPLGRAARWTFAGLLACLRELLIKFAIADCSDRGVDHGWQLVERRNGNCGFAFFRTRLASTRFERTVVLLHPLPIGSSVVRVSQDELLLLETGDNFGVEESWVRRRSTIGLLVQNGTNTSLSRRHCRQIDWRSREDSNL